MLQAAEQETLDVKQQLSAIEHLNHTCQTSSSPSARPSSHAEACQRPPSQCCNAAAFSQQACYPDIQQTSVRVLEEETQQLERTVDGLKHRLQVLLVYNSQLRMSYARLLRAGLLMQAQLF